MRNAAAVIILPKRRSLVHHASAAVVGNVEVVAHAEGCGLEFLVVIKERHVLLSQKLRSQHLANALKAHIARLALLAGGSSSPRQLADAALPDDVHFAGGRVLELHVLEGGVDAQRHVGGQGPGGGGPRHHGGVVLVVDEGERHHDGGVGDVLVVEAGLEVGEGRVAGRGVGHHLEPAVHLALLKQGLEHPPHTLHEVGIHGLVIVLEVNPPAHATHDGLPLLGVPCDDATALLVVGRDAHLHHIVLRLDAQLLVDLVLHRQAVAVPPEPPHHVAPRG
mmetsp:Transcript_6835/g.11799  ORF Transcript_6835/g.11799 Transcript_6835/m.11799 type:complete len:278 (-) Transcript_6835:300-1133(-)